MESLAGLDLDRKYFDFEVWDLLHGYHVQSLEKIVDFDHGNTGCFVFKWGDKKLGRVFTKNQHTQRKVLNLIDVVASCLKLNIIL